ncbi:hypothetical protein Murru_1573 [Allomuricauda ruestringensis DSM 13258]|uniref:FeoB-associated Cys-rich membrane protein n=1 Tax=Allomuricauda ruestringensis (strain DSM 13258 / CIP 107369 / LMG 19739 / B1) TaxID=886377 RepID=G2PI40_ALLRU|nr:hypothetical protein [Allomuricauda ruestringensis]AEM70614.1 hypothetical protein Murru_1573 [Allomuricauda ruestringensis DSM 13258]
MIQQILAYGTLLVAAGYLVWKFLLPKSLFSKGNNNSNSCGQDNCGCS